MTRRSKTRHAQQTVAPPRDARSSFAPSGGARVDFVPLLIAALAVAIRLPHLDWGLPAVEEEAFPMRRALEMWGWEQGRIQWNPETAGWPAFSFYAHLALQHVHYAIGRLFGGFATRTDYVLAFWIDPTPLTLWSRALSVAASAAVAGIGSHLASRLAGRGAAIVVGLVLAVSPLLVEHGRLVTPDVLVALFTALAVLAMVDLHERGRMRDYMLAGLWIGLGTATKYTPILLLPGLIVAHVLVMKREHRRFLWRDALDRRFALSLAAVFVSFAVTNPFFWIDTEVMQRDLAWQFMHMTEGHFGQGARSPRFIAYIVQVLGPAMGFPALIASVAGLGYAAIRRRGAWLVVAACVLPYYLVLAGFNTYFARYMVPIVMPLTLGLAAWSARLDALAIPARARGVLVTVAAIVLLAFPAYTTWRYVIESGRPTARQLATSFFETDSAGADPYIATEVLGVTLRRDRWLSSVSSGFLAMLNEEQRRRLASIRTFHADYLPMYTTHPEASTVYYDLRHWLPYDYIVTCDAVRSRYLADSTAYPIQTGFYRDLARFGRVVRRYGPAQGASGREVTIHRLEPVAKAVLLAERGPVVPGFEIPYLNALDIEDFLEFVEGVGRAALRHGDVRTAERYYTTMLAVSEHTMPEEARSQLAAFIAQLRTAGTAGATPKTARPPR